MFITDLSDRGLFVVDSVGCVRGKHIKQTNLEKSIVNNVFSGRIETISKYPKKVNLNCLTAS